MRSIALALATLTLLPTAHAGDGIEAARYGWLADYAKARALAKQSGKPLMVVLRCVP